jgi:hypothetical protein
MLMNVSAKAESRSSASDSLFPPRSELALFSPPAVPASSLATATGALALRRVKKFPSNHSIHHDCETKVDLNDEKSYVCCCVEKKEKNKRVVERAFLFRNGHKKGD